MLMSVMSIGDPAQLSHHAGLGAHTYRFVNAGNRIGVRQVPLEPHAATLDRVGRGGVRSLRQYDFHRRDLWESIEAGAFPDPSSACR